jgi:heme-degrading monooxygenase HmoA
MIVSVLRLPVRSGCEEEVAQFCVDRDVFGLAARGGGFHSASLLAPSEPGAPFLVLAEWEDGEAYRRWLEAPAREKLASELSPMLEGEPGGSTYSVVITTTSEGTA